MHMKTEKISSSLRKRNARVILELDRHTEQPSKQGRNCCQYQYQYRNIDTRLTNEAKLSMFGREFQTLMMRLAKKRAPMEHLQR